MGSTEPLLEVPHRWGDGAAGCLRFDAQPGLVVERDEEVHLTLLLVSQVPEPGVCETDARPEVASLEEGVGDEVPTPTRPWNTPEMAVEVAVVLEIETLSGPDEKMPPIPTLILLKTDR